VFIECHFLTVGFYVTIGMGQEHMPISKSIIEAAIVGFEEQKRQIDVQLAELRAMLTGGSAETTAAAEAAPGKRKKFSAGARRRMALTQKARWAKQKGEAEPAATIPAQEPKLRRKMLAAAKAKLVANLKKARAAKAAMAKSAVTKKTAPALALAQKPKRKLSAAGLKAIIASNKKMWERRRAAAKEA
jgi:hypothetical protein